MVRTDSLLTFNVRRREPELIAPTSPTPRELKLLSDIDDQDGLRLHSYGIQFHRASANMQNKDPVSVIREALAKVLVFYYPLAGRLKEGPARKLMVDCTGEGVLFIEADVDVTLQQFGDPLIPPFPCMDELLYDVPGSSGILNSPLLLQVTRLQCGGFILTTRNNHTMCDGSGAIQFMAALGDIAKGASKPSIIPVWQRELLFARDPPRVTCTHNEYTQVKGTKEKIIPLDDMAHKSILVRRSDVSALRRLLPPHLQKCSTFDVLTACLWRCRTISLQPDDPEQETRLICAVSARGRFNPPLLPVGYYGNSIALPVAITTARDLSTKPLSHALELVMKTKSVVTEEYMRSLADLMVTTGRPKYTVVNTYTVSDMTRMVTHAGGLDCGWGKPAYAGPPEADVCTYYIPYTNKKGESGIVLPMCLPSAAMDKFVTELNKMLTHENKQHQDQLSKL